MAIKIIQHKQTPKELAYHFKCNCGCEFWSDSEGVLVAKSLNVILFYQTQCPECGSRVESHEIWVAISLNDLDKTWILKKGEFDACKRLRR